MTEAETDIEIIFKALSSGASANANESRRRREIITVYVVHTAHRMLGICCFWFSTVNYNAMTYIFTVTHTTFIYGVSMELS